MNRNFEVNEQGHNIRCKIYFSNLAAARKAVIFGHGFAGHKDNKAAERFAEKALSKHKDLVVITFNWPCHGDDVKKKLILEDCSTYLELVIAHIRKQYGIEDFYAYATSFGGYMMLKYISERGNPFRKIALRCPAIHMYGTLSKNLMKSDDFDKLAKGKPVQVGFDRKIAMNAQFLNDLQEADIRQRDFLDYAEDILILHGTKDEVVPLEDSQVFADNNLIAFIPMENADHRFQNQQSMDLATKYVLDFFFS